MTKQERNKIYDEVNALIRLEEEVLKKSWEEFLESGFGAEAHDKYARESSAGLSAIYAYGQALKVIEKIYKENKDE